ncbi:MAG: IS66 family transposase [Gammaproteobacteria bacterium]
MKPDLDEIELTRQQSEELIERLENERLSADDRQQLAKVIRVFFWLTLTVRESKLSMKRLKAALFGRASGKKRTKPPDDNAHGGGAAATISKTSSSDRPSDTPSETPPDADSTGSPDAPPPEGNQQRRGHGRYGADAYTGAETVSCPHEGLAAGERCPLCGHGTLYALDAGVTIRVDGNALLSAVRYEVERLRCSACTDVFTAPLPAGSGTQKYSARAQVALAVSRYFLGVPFYRLQQLQAMVGVPVADATQWDQAERVADAAWPVFGQLEYLAAQCGLIYHDDTGVRVLSLIRENRSDTPPERVGMYTTGLVACSAGHDERTIVLYYCGRAHAGENLAKLLARREVHLAPPLVMSDALAANQAGGLPEHIRCHCLSHALRQFTDIDETFPEPCQRVIDDLKAVYEHDQHARELKLAPQRRLVHHQAHSEPIMTELRVWLKHQWNERLVEPNSSLGKAMAYLDKHWESLTQFLRVPGAPLDSNTVERALKLMIRQRKNSLFFATAHSAYVAGLLASLIATCAEAGVNAMDYLVALLDNRSDVFAQPAQWLPWNYTLAG